MAKKRSFEMACGVAEFDLKKRRNSAKSGVVGSSEYGQSYPPLDTPSFLLKKLYSMLISDVFGEYTLK